MREIYGDGTFGPVYFLRYSRHAGWGEANTPFPFYYTAVPWGAAWGYALWGEVPDAATLGGAALILGAGLYALYRERRETRLADADTLRLIVDLSSGLLIGDPAGRGWPGAR
ncbi:MAG: DMT family transporter [Gemmatimonadota bacterium]